ncbi:hypothetical protein BC937DRAFT_94534 [Endogone sp. FLAS-F59071]|nr:hypothetical protein BC937DRAFT_94534 [Endogone sp. FLAS-F59071]|eukprot:RUS13965.1 hypothetical protein BC937DRAFT_94534 [Endogone sp. FLAS-F59071]
MPEDPQPNSLTAAEQFLESLGDITSAPVAVDPTDPSSASQPANAREILSFLDEITANSTVEEETAVSSSNSSPPPPLEPATATTAAAATAGAWVSWGNSLWSQASQAVKTTTEQIAKTAADPETARRLEERVKGLGNLVNTDNINKISELYILLEWLTCPGSQINASHFRNQWPLSLSYYLVFLGTDLRNLTLSSVTTILETVVPAIAEHEIVEVWLAHDMVGYVGVEALVYRAFAKVMEQTEAGDVVVRKGDSATGEKAATVEGGEEERDLNLCEGIEEGVKLAKVGVLFFPNMIEKGRVGCT